MICQVINILWFTNINEKKLLDVRKVYSKQNIIKRKLNAENPCSGVLFSWKVKEKIIQGIIKLNL